MNKYLKFKIGDLVQYYGSGVAAEIVAGKIIRTSDLPLMYEHPSEGCILCPADEYDYTLEIQQPEAQATIRDVYEHEIRRYRHRRPVL